MYKRQQISQFTTMVPDFAKIIPLLHEIQSRYCQTIYECPPGLFRVSWKEKCI